MSNCGIPDRADELKKENAAPDPHDLPPPDAYDPVIEVYKKDVDRTLPRENLKLTPEERARKFISFMRCLEQLQEAGKRAREEDPSWGLR